MARTNKIPSSLVIIPFAVLLLRLHLVSGAAEFIRTRCDRTLYRDLCYDTLVKYAKAIQQDPAVLATAALKVSLSNTKEVAAYTLNLSRSSNYDSDPQSKAALHDCVSLFQDAVSQVRDSIKEMKQLERKGESAESIKVWLNNIQTWMSGAMTNEDTCMQGFQEAGNDDLKNDIHDRSVHVNQITSIALTLVNIYVPERVA